MISFTMSQLVAHLVGDYALQSDWMANEKTKSTMALAAHGVFYTLPFLLITDSLQALIVIYITHVVIDRWRLARFVCWAKNFIGVPPICLDCGGEDHVKHTDWDYLAWKNCSGTGYHHSRPPWMSVWLFIITDNTMHLICNAAAISLLGDSQWLSSFG